MNGASNEDASESSNVVDLTQDSDEDEEEDEDDAPRKRIKSELERPQTNWYVCTAISLVRYKIQESRC